MADSRCCTEGPQDMEQDVSEESVSGPGQHSPRAVVAHNKPQQQPHQQPPHPQHTECISLEGTEQNNNSSPCSRETAGVTGLDAVNRKRSHEQVIQNDLGLLPCADDLAGNRQRDSNASSSSSSVPQAASCLPASAEAASATTPTPAGLETGLNRNQPSSFSDGTPAREIAMPDVHRRPAPSILVHQSTIEIPVQENHRLLHSPTSGGPGGQCWESSKLAEASQEEEADSRGLLAAFGMSDNCNGRGDATEDESSDWEAPVDVDLQETPCPAISKRPSKAKWTTVRAVTRLLPYSRPKHPWTQMAGHAGSFLAGPRGTVLKQLVSQEERNLHLLMQDAALKPHVPHYHGNMVKDGNCYVRLQDLLCEFTSPCVMDIKMGVRTYLEEELEKARKKPTPRRDLFLKMMSIDPDAATETEKEQDAILKPRYMKFRDDMSSTSSLGFRIEGIKTHKGASKDFKNTRTRDDVRDALHSFVGRNAAALEKYISSLGDICQAMRSSNFCQSHEIVGTSLLFIHEDSGKAGAWLIDFAKCCLLPLNVSTNHRSPWVPGNYEDGFLFGLDNLQSMFQDLVVQLR